MIMRELYLPQHSGHAISSDFRPLSAAHLRDPHTIKPRAPDSSGRPVRAEAHQRRVPAEQSEVVVPPIAASQSSPHLVVQEVDHASVD